MTKKYGVDFTQMKYLGAENNIRDLFYLKENSRDLLENVKMQSF